MKVTRIFLLVLGGLYLFDLVLPYRTSAQRYELIFVVKCLVAIGVGFLAYRYATYLCRSGVKWGIFSTLLPFIVPLALAFMKRVETIVQPHEMNSDWRQKSVSISPETPVVSPIFLARGSTQETLTIPELTPQQLSISLVDSSTIGPAGPGAASFQQAIQTMNNSNHDDAIYNFRQALNAGLDPLRQGYVHANLGSILIKRGNLAGAIEEFIKVLSFNEALYESVHDAGQYLGVIMTELGRQKEADALQLLTAKTSAQLGYSLSPDAAEDVRRLVRLTPIEKPLSPEEETDKQHIEVLKDLCRAYSTNNEAETARLEPLARKIGISLNARGGLPEMRRVFETIASLRGARTLEMHWNGIGDWQG